MTLAAPRTLHISELFPETALAEAIEQGHVRRQGHPALPLSILNYTERATYERAWTDVTRQCRGLIVDTAGNIVARPWPKFFNYGEDAGAGLDLHAPAEVTDKMDGSLGILYRADDGWAIATRGSFASEQAAHASEVLRGRYADYEPPEGVTVLFEIIYPQNRIVLDYAGMDDLVLLGGVDMATGRDVPADTLGWPGLRAAVFECGTLAEALALPPRPNAEGVVVRMLGTGTRVKLKQSDYVELHRLVTGMNARVVWERIGAGETADGICAALPEEFWPWVHDVAGELLAAQHGILEAASAEHARVAAALPHGWTRKDYALAVSGSDLRPWLFLLLDGKDPSGRIWRTLRPSGDRALVSHSEDVA